MRENGGRAVACFIFREDRLTVAEIKLFTVTPGEKTDGPGITAEMALAGFQTGGETGRFDQVYREQNGVYRMDWYLLPTTGKEAA